MSRWKYIPHRTASVIRSRANEHVKPNRRQMRSMIRSIRWQGEDQLRSVRQCHDYIGLEFKHIFIGVEEDGYAHS